MFARGFDAPFGQLRVPAEKPSFVSGFDAPFGQSRVLAEKPSLVAIQKNMYVEGFDAPFGQSMIEAREWAPPVTSLFDREVVFGDKDLFTLDD